MKNPIYDPYQILMKVYGEGAHLKQAMAETLIDESNRLKTVKIVYGVLEEDGYLTQCIRAFADKSPKLPVRVILKISLYMILKMGKTRYMVTDNAVALCKKLGKGGAAGFVNAFLRGFDEGKVTFPDGDEGLALRYGYPRFLVDKLRKQYGGRTEAILSARSHGVSVRFEEGEEEYLSRPHEDTPFAHTFLFKNFTRDENFFEGKYTFQSVGSIAIADVVAPVPEGTLLDACAAPGGKSVLLAKKFKEVTSFELYEHRVKLIDEYAARMRVKNVRATQKDSSVADPVLFASFDAVLCDVPCSGVGTVSENPDLKLRKTQEDLAALTGTQTAILSASANYVKRGGRLYYSTCSLLREENDDRVEAFLKGGGWTVVPIDSPLAHERTAYGLQFLPDEAFGAGFYVAALERKEKDG
ncbi:MAG: transcription antitermination factor NusB [Christensenellaceae bacterium]